MSVRERAEQVTEWASNLHAAGFGEYLSESAWVARQLLEALDRIEQLEAELEAQKGVSAYFADRANELEGDA